jgi:hypothetical protein
MLGGLTRDQQLGLDHGSLFGSYEVQIMNLPPLPDVDLDTLTLAQKQRRFVLMKAYLIAWAYSNGYELTDGDAYRDPRVHGNMGAKPPISYSEARSAHKQRLAQDFNLFIKGRFVTNTEEHRPLGEVWEGMGGTWGGRFNDGNHYSLAHAGIK